MLVQMVRRTGEPGTGTADDTAQVYDLLRALSPAS
jgi:hypothetical protein